MAGSRKDAADVKSSVQAVLIQKSSQNVRKPKEPHNRFKPIYDDPNRTDVQVDECFAKCVKPTLLEIYTGICSYRTNAKCIEALKYFEICIHQHVGDEDYVTEARDLTNELLTQLIDQCKTVDDLDELKEALEKLKTTKSAPYYVNKRYSFFNLAEKPSDHWEKIQEKLNATAGRVLGLKVAGDVGARINVGRVNTLEKDKPQSPSPGYRSLD